MANDRTRAMFIKISIITLIILIVYYGVAIGFIASKGGKITNIENDNNSNQKLPVKLSSNIPSSSQRAKLTLPINSYYTLMIDGNGANIELPRLGGGYAIKYNQNLISVKVTDTNNTILLSIVPIEKFGRTNLSIVYANGKREEVTLIGIFKTEINAYVNQTQVNLNVGETRTVTLTIYNSGLNNGEVNVDTSVHSSNIEVSVPKNKINLPENSYISLPVKITGVSGGDGYAIIKVNDKILILKVNVESPVANINCPSEIEYGQNLTINITLLSIEPVIVKVRDKIVFNKILGAGRNEITIPVKNYTSYILPVTIEVGKFRKHVVVLVENIPDKLIPPEIVTSGTYLPINSKFLIMIYNPNTRPVTLNITTTSPLKWVKINYPESVKVEPFRTAKVIVTFNQTEPVATKIPVSVKISMGNNVLLSKILTVIPKPINIPLSINATPMMNNKGIIGVTLSIHSSRPVENASITYTVYAIYDGTIVKQIDDTTRTNLNGSLTIITPEFYPAKVVVVNVVVRVNGFTVESKSIPLKVGD